MNYKNVKKYIFNIIICSLLVINSFGQEYRNSRGPVSIGDATSGDNVDVVQGNLKTIIAYKQSPDDIYNTLDVQSPLPIDGDSLYSKDVWVDESDLGDFSGTVLDLVNNLHSVITNTTATNPKEILIHFNRTIVSNSLGLGAYSGNFSNVEIQVGTSGGVFLTLYDGSADNTKRTSQEFKLPVTAGYNAIKLKFHTADTVTLSNFVLLKARSVIARTQAVGPDNRVVDIKGTIDGETRVWQDFFDAVRVTGTSFDGANKDTNFWTETVTGSGSVTQNGNIVVSTGTTANSTAKYQSTKKARFISGTDLEFRALGEISTAAQADNTRRFGPYDVNNGFFFQINGATFSLGSRTDRTGSPVDTIIDSGDFNGISTTNALVVDQSYRLKIRYGANRVLFCSDEKLIHTITLNNTTRPTTLTFPITTENINSNGNTTNNSHILYDAAIYTLGRIQTGNAFKYLTGAGTTVLKYGAGHLHRILNNDNAGSYVVYDNTAGSGTIMASVDAVKVLGTLEFNAPFSNGLTIVITGSAKLTVVYE